MAVPQSRDRRSRIRPQADGFTITYSTEFFTLRVNRATTGRSFMKIHSTLYAVVASSCTKNASVTPGASSNR